MYQIGVAGLALAVSPARAFGDFRILEAGTLTNHGLFALVLTGIALYLFTRDRIALESSSLAVLLVLVAVFQVFPFATDGAVVPVSLFFSGFGNEALIAVCALMIVGKGIETTGALQPLAGVIATAWQARPALAMLATLVVGAVLSAFLNNTPIVVLLLPILVGVAMRANLPVSGILMPMGLATIVGGMATTIGTSTNLLVSGISDDLGLEPFGLFDFTLPVAIVGGIGILFLWLVAPLLLPQREPPLADTSPRVFTAQLYVVDGSFAVGRSLSEVRAKTNGRLRIDRIQRGDSLFLAKLPSVKFQTGDRIYVKDTAEQLKAYEQELGAKLFKADGEDAADGDVPFAAPGQQLAEVVVTRGSLLHRRTLDAVRFPATFGLLPLALHRARFPSSRVTQDIGSIRLRAGDVLLVQGTGKAIDTLKENGAMLVLDGTTELPHTHRANRALGIMGFVILTAAFGVLPIAASALIGVGLMLWTHCLTWENVAEALSVPIVMIIVTSLALGNALMVTGTADYLALAFVELTSGLSIPVILSGFMLIMSVLTNVVSNNAAAVIGTPIAVSIATQLGVDPKPFVLAVLFGANMSYATPIGYQTNLLVLSAGGYSFTDFLRVGIPLTLIMWLGFSIVLPMLYGL
ncbi:MAG: SLC13 family permease [Pseudomonadota bacterium]